MKWYCQQETVIIRGWNGGIRQVDVSYVLADVEFYDYAEYLFFYLSIKLIKLMLF